MSEKLVLGIKEHALEKINSLQKVDPDFVFSWLSGLTDLEQKIVSAMYLNNKALTIKDIINSLIKNTYSVLFTRDYPPNVKYAKEFDFPFCSYYLVGEELKNRMFKQSSIEDLGNLGKYHFMPFEQAVKILKKEMKFPSFRRIDKSIQDLMAMGVVLAREEPSENKKIKGLYYLNPVIRTQINKLKDNKKN